MLVKLIGAVIVAVLAGAYPPTRSYAIPIFLIAVIVVFVIEAVRIVPQQQAWVVERLGKFSETLQPGLNLIIPFFERIGRAHV